MRAVIVLGPPVLPLHVRARGEGRDETPVDRAAALEGRVELLQLRVEPLGRRGACAFSFFSSSGRSSQSGSSRRSICVKSYVSTTRVQLAGFLFSSTNGALYGLAVLALAEGRVAGVDAAVDDRPREVPAGDVEEAPRGVGLDGQRGPRDRRRRLAVQAHGVDARVRRAGLDAADQLGDGHDQLEPVGLRGRGDASAVVVKLAAAARRVTIVSAPTTRIIHRRSGAGGAGPAAAGARDP